MLSNLWRGWLADFVIFMTKPGCQFISISNLYAELIQLAVASYSKYFYSALMQGYVLGLYWSNAKMYQGHTASVHFPSPTGYQRILVEHSYYQG